MPLISDWFSRVVVGTARETALQLLCLAAPFFVLALMLHVLEWQVQRSLSRQFGWSSVLVTGWIGTSVHELSHAAMCLPFGHRIDEIALFKPDKTSGRLGYVNHSFNPRNPWHVVGNFFIGTAPLAGGTLVLYGLLWLFFPSAARHVSQAGSLSESLAAGNIGEAAAAVLAMARGVFSEIFTRENLLSWRLWPFLYLALCVGSHLAPSKTDYDNALWGGLLLVILVGFNFVFLCCGGKPGWLTSVSAPILGPLLGLLALCVVLCTGATALVWIVTSALGLIRGVG